jgi:ribosomal protein S9
LTYGKEDIKVEDIVAALLGHDQRRKNNATEESFGDAFLVRDDRSMEDKKGSKKKGPRCFKCKG